MAQHCRQWNSYTQNSLNIADKQENISNFISFLFKKYF